MPAEMSVAVVGLGSRGLGVLERLICLADPARPLRVEVIDPVGTGAGVHALGQPDYLLLNTTCGQVSMFPDACSVGEQLRGTGPSLYEWATERGLRIAADGFTVGGTGRPVRPTDFLPRRVLGEYLQWFLGYLLARLPEHVSVRLHRACATDLGSDGGDGLVVTLSDGLRLPVRYAFLTTGYTGNRPPEGDWPGAERVIAVPYPLPDRLAEVRAGQVVAIGGFGLSAMDVMSSLTVGRGGEFVPDGDRLRYLASGREPELLFYSRSGLPCRARPKVVEFGPAYQPLVFTRAAVDELRRQRQGPLDFRRDVWPLILTEVRIAYRRTQARCAGPAAEVALAEELAAVTAAAGIGGIVAVLDALDARLGRFDPAAALDGSAGMSLHSSDSYQRWLAAVISADLAEAVHGFARSPVKGALDVLRALREQFRYVVDFGGLTPESGEDFAARIVPALNRAVVGPQYERHLELLALLEAGIASAPFGPAASADWQPESGRWRLASSRLREPCSREADWLVAARVDSPAVDASTSPLLNALHAKGWIRRHRPGSRQLVGIDIDADQHPLDVAGRPDRRLWVLGPLCEGATFYNHLVPSPGAFSRPVSDAHRCVSALFAAEWAAAARQPALTGRSSGEVAAGAVT
ncbi:FAD/NAD(P)-binding protein [Jatrophihabitans sp.]|uniref:FAD/NAD(P)-binding protein n=1 Tax=Jatrophihabitans sp. TaxID=1932789 RepID=UPI002C291EF1|nr:FAD/NAD(P)-binding protein [Jatrophihabitans sp.]